MNIRKLFFECASVAVFLSLATTAQAERLAFMPRGEEVAAPPGFVDLCQRDLSTCGSARNPTTMLAATPDLLPTSSLGGSGDQHVADRLLAEAAQAQAEPMLIQVESLTAYRPTIDATFTPVGVERAPVAAPVEIARLDPQASTSASRPALLDKSQMRLVNALNRDVNREVQKANDFDLYGLLEFWSLPRVIDGKMYGDCEDYALEKRRRLIAAGVPAEAMSMAVAVTARGESHAVLVVSFESGDWVLDNLTPWATPWNELNYRWVERQIPGSAEWVKIA